MANKSKARNVSKASSSKRRGARKQDREQGRDDISDYRQKIRAKKLAEGNKSKKGCSPKLLMLLLPFIAVGAYFFLIS